MVSGAAAHPRVGCVTSGHCETAPRSLALPDRTGSVTQRLVEPLGLVAKAGIWYLVAFEPDKGYRSFRAERIIGVDDTAQEFTRPVNFDLDAYWRSSVASMERRPAQTYDVVLRVRSDAVAQLAYWEFEVVADSAGFATIRIRFAGRNLAIFQTLALGDAATIIEPPDLREAVVACARSALAQHA